MLPGVGRLWSLARKVEDLFKLQEQIAETVASIDRRLRSLEDRVLKMETEQPFLVDRARDAARAASTVASGAALNDLVTRLTRAEMRMEQLVAAERSGRGAAKRQIEGGG